MEKKEGSMIESINFRIGNSANEFLDLISNPEKRSDFSKANVSRDLIYWSIMWVIECFPKLRDGDFKDSESILKQIRREGKDSLSLRIKIENIIHQTTERRKE